MLDKVTNGTQIDIDHTGTSVIYRPGLIINGRKLTHDCGTARGIGYFLEGLICLAPFGKVPLHITLKGITNHRLDPSVWAAGQLRIVTLDLQVDVVRTVSIPLLARFGVDDGAELKVVRRGAPPLGGGMIVFQCPVVRGIKPLQLTEVGKVKRIRGLACVQWHPLSVTDHCQVFYTCCSNYVKPSGGCCSRLAKYLHP